MVTKAPRSVPSRPISYIVPLPLRQKLHIPRHSWCLENPGLVPCPGCPLWGPVIASPQILDKWRDVNSSSFSLKQDIFLPSSPRRCVSYCYARPMLLGFSFPVDHADASAACQAGCQIRIMPDCSQNHTINLCSSSILLHLRGEGFDDCPLLSICIERLTDMICSLTGSRIT